MTTLSAGASVTLDVGDGGYLKVSTNGGMASVTVTPTGGSASTVNMGPLPVRQTFGPYAEGARIMLNNATAEIDYDYSTGGNLLSASQVAALFAGGYRCALAFDSMTDFNFTVANASSVTYAGGVITVTMGSAHLMPVGQKFNFWNRSYTSINAVQTLTVASVTSSTVFTATLNAGTYSDLAATLTGTSYVVPFNSKCSKSWLTWLNARGNQRVDIVRNDAQSGDTSTQFLARLPALITAWQADGVNLVVGQMVGVNDIVIDTATQTNDTALIFTNLRTIFDTIRLAGFKMLVGTITPVTSGEARAQRSIMMLVQTMNNWLWNYAQRYADQITVIDGYPQIVSPTDTLGLARSGVLAAADKIHFTSQGAYAIAAAEQSKFNAALPVYRSTLPTSALDSQAQSILSSPTGVASGGVVTISAVAAYVEEGQEVFVRGATGSYLPLNGRQVSASTTASGTFTIACNVPDGTVAGTLVISPSRQLMADPLMLTTGGTAPSGGIAGATGDVPGQWNAKGIAGTVTGVASIVADSEGFGNASRISVTAASAVDARVGWTFKNSVGTLETKMLPGRTYVFEAKLVLGSTNWAQTPVSEVQFELNITANTTETWRMCDLNQYENVIPLIASGTASETLHLKTAPLTVAAGATLSAAQATISVRWQAAQAAGTLTMDLSRVAFRDVTNDYPVA